MKKAFSGADDGIDLLGVGHRARPQTEFGDLARQIVTPGAVRPALTDGETACGCCGCVLFCVALRVGQEEPDGSGSRDGHVLRVEDAYQADQTVLDDVWGGGDGDARAVWRQSAEVPFAHESLLAEEVS